MSMNQLTVRSQPGQITGFFPAAPTYIDAIVLGTPDTAETFTVPTGCNAIIISGDADFYANPNGTAAAPSTEVADGTGSFLNPSQWRVDNVTGGTISFVSGVVCKITIACYVV